MATSAAAATTTDDAWFAERPRGFYTTSTAAWGNPTWVPFHMAAMKLLGQGRDHDVVDPVVERRLRGFYALYDVALPCSICEEHYPEGLQKRPLPAEMTPDALSRWTVDFHNDVNRRLGKREVPYDVARAWYVPASAGPATAAPPKTAGRVRTRAPPPQKPPPSTNGLLLVAALAILLLVSLAILFLGARYVK
jgi:hypothetical protein